MEAPNIPEARQAAGHALQRFMQLVTAPLNLVEGQRLTDAVLTTFDRCGDAGEAFQEGVLDEGGQTHGQWLVIQVDWKAHEEIEWQVAEVASSVGIQESWGWASSVEIRTVPAGLCAVASWAASLGYELVHLDLDHDAYYALMVKAKDATEVYQVAKVAGLNVLCAADFASANS